MRPVALAVAASLALGAAPAAAQPATPATPAQPATPAHRPHHVVPSAPIRALRSSAWDRSVALERDGEVAAARDALELAWTAEPESYEVALRTGWLSLRLDEVERAVARYERARSLPGATAEAERGLAATHTRAGYQDLAAGARAEARRHFDAALALDPETPDAAAGRALAPSERISPELWASFVGWSLGPSRAYGGGVFVALPVELADDARLRAAYRHLELSATEAGSGAGVGRGAAGRLRRAQDEAYLGAGYSGALFGLEALGLVVAPSGTSAQGGEAVRLRVGRRYGVVLEEAALGGGGAWSVQLAPSAFVWPTEWLGLALGARATFDATGRAGSGVAGASFVYAPVELHLSGHVGVERARVDFDAPSVLDAIGDVTGGGTLGLFVGLDDEWALGVHAELWRLAANARVGTHESASLGLRFAPAID